MDWGLRLCFLLALPSAVALGILAKPLTVALFQYGKFSAFDAATAPVRPSWTAVSSSAPA